MRARIYLTDKEVTEALDAKSKKELVDSVGVAGFTFIKARMESDIATWLEEAVANRDYSLQIAAQDAAEAFKEMQGH